MYVCALYIDTFVYRPVRTQIDGFMRACDRDCSLHVSWTCEGGTACRHMFMCDVRSVDALYISAILLFVLIVHVCIAIRSSFVSSDSSEFVM